MIIKNLDNISIPEFIIIGAGPASITLALELEKKNKKILILEAGSDHYEEDSQDFYKGKTIGDQYFELDHCRLRFLGGSTGHYNGRLHPYDEIDFNEWPIKKNDLDPFTKKTNQIFEIKEKFYEKESILNDFYLANHIVSPIRFGGKYFQNLKKSKNIFLHFNASVFSINESDDNLKKINSITVVNNKQKKNILVNKLILACGGIENSRILLWSSKISKTNFLKTYPIGNYWMEHPSGKVGQFIGETEKLNKLFDGGLKSRNRYLIPNPKLVVKEKLNNSRIEFVINENPKLKDKTFKHYLKDILCVAPIFGKKIVESIQNHQMLHCFATVYIQSEMKPSFENRIKLSDSEVDKNGVPRVELHWNVKNDFFQSSEIILKKLGEDFIKFDIGRIGIDRYIFDKTLKNIQTYKTLNPWSKEIRTLHKENVFGGYHHMGGTRMSANKENGVVDSNLKVHEFENFYIIGSSVFPTSGHWNPTYTIVQLSLRLAKHLAI